MWSFFGKLHPLIIHFPIALFIVACVLEFLHFRRARKNSHEPSIVAFVCLILGAISAWVAAAAGLVDAESAGFSGSAAEILVNHRTLGLASAAVATAAAFAALSARKIASRGRFILYRIVLIASAACVSLAAHDGGKLVYGENYLSDAWSDANNPESRRAGAAADFNHQILPILTKRCFACHTGEKPESEYSLATRERALKGGKSGRAAIIPKNSKDSRILTMLTGAPGGTRMPPRGNPLAESEIDMITKWIDAGAPWGETSAGGEHWHWAYRAPRRPPLPTVNNIYWPRNAIDYFILEQLENEKMEPSPEADRATLLRRLSYDLTGLPPTVEEVESFMNDPSGDAYDRAVDRLLASPRFGERFARPWLDLARFADTQGYEKDNRRSMWPYRDWVIDALNADMPFDEFTIEQLAGDLLVNSTMSQKVATGFHRNTMINEEGGVDPEEFRVDAVVDRTNTTATAWLGSTFGCAQCHNHKFDPISTKEYYQFYAFFNNTIDEVDHLQFESKANEASTIRVAALDKRVEYEKLQEEITKLMTELNRVDLGLHAWRLAYTDFERFDLKHWVPIIPTSATALGGTKLTIGGDGVIIAGGAAPATDVYTIETDVTIPKITQIRLELLPRVDDKNPVVGRADHGNIVLNEFTASIGGRAVKFSAAQADYEQGEKYGGDGEWPAHRTIDGSGDAAHGWALAGSVNKPHTIIYRPDSPIAAVAGEKLTFKLIQNYGGHTIARFKLSVRGDDSPGLAAPVPEDIAQITNIAYQKQTAEQTSRLADFFSKFNHHGAPLRSRLAAARVELESIPTGNVYILKERSEPRETYIHTRGNFLSKGEKVDANVPSVFPPLPEGAARNRLTLARWLVDAKNPLTARVQVNRWWSYLFGRGIVETEEDFGTRGDEPTHPKLLDWLATELNQRGWGMKSMLRLIVTSATYRQSSNITNEARERDPNNKYYGRAPRFRLEAEMLRDGALAIGGLLSKKIGGPSVFPPQPDGLWTMIYNSDQWMNSTGEDRYRRGIYTFWRRTAPYPTFTTFDAPTRETSCTRRPRTNTPLQALVTLNDPQFVEAAVALGRRMLDRKDGDPKNCIIYGFTSCASRKPSAAETERLLKLYNEQRAAFAAKPEEAIKLLKNAPSFTSLGAEADLDWAAWGAVANVLLNLDETLVRY